MTPERDWVDYASILVDIAALVVTLGGLAFVVAALRQSGGQQRIDSAPYVRIDIGPEAGIVDRPNVDAYYEDTSQHVSITDADEPSIDLSAWFRNYQSSDLGFAMGVTATFMVQISEEGERSVHFVDVEIPYLEFKKAVKVNFLLSPDRRMCW